MVALRRLSAKTFGTLMSFEPALAAIAGVAVLHEHLTPIQWLAIGFIVVASLGTWRAASIDGGEEPQRRRRLMAELKLCPTYLRRGAPPASRPDVRPAAVTNALPQARRLATFSG